MLKRLITLFKLGRKLAKSDVLSIVSKFNKPPLLVTVIFKLLSFSFTKKDMSLDNLSEGEKLSNSLASMGTTFIKLGQFLATRPDIIGDKLSKELENLQDKLPPFSQSKAKEMIKNDLGDEIYNSIIKDGTQYPLLDIMQTREELYEVLDYYNFEKQLDEKLSKN